MCPPAYLNAVSNLSLSFGSSGDESVSPLAFDLAPEFLRAYGPPASPLAPHLYHGMLHLAIEAVQQAPATSQIVLTAAQQAVAGAR